MSRTPSELVARLPKLEAARKDLGRKRLILKAEEMARLCGMTWRALRDYWVERDKKFPVKTRGGNGVAYEFDAARVLDHMISKARAAQADHGRRRAHVSRLAGLGDPPAGEHPPAGGSGQAGGSGTAAREMREQAQALEAVLDLQARVRNDKIAQGLLIERREVERFLWGWVSALQAEVLAIERKVDRNGRLEPGQRKAVKEELANALLRFRTRLEQFIGPKHAPDASPDRSGDRTAGLGSVSRPDRGRRRARSGAAHSA